MDSNPLIPISGIRPDRIGPCDRTSEFVNRRPTPNLTCRMDRNAFPLFASLPMRLDSSVQVPCVIQFCALTERQTVQRPGQNTDDWAGHHRETGECDQSVPWLNPALH